MLDAACGIGIDALALHRRGLRVTATDASRAMVEQCRARLGEADVDLPVSICTWEDLPARFGAVFDAVLCTGNSLAHTLSDEARRAAVAGLAGVLAPLGSLVLDSQDWSVLHRQGSHTDDDPLVVERDGHRVTRRFDWQVPERFGDLIRLTLTLRIDGVVTVSHEVTFRPFTTDTLVDELRGAGLAEVTVTQVPGDDRFAVVARR